MSKNNQGLKLQKSTEKVHYRMFKSGKVWLFAAVATFTVATGATVTANADTVDDTAASTTAVVTSSATSATPAADSTVTSSAATSANSVVLGSQAPSDVTTTPASSADSSSASLAGTNIADSDYATSSQSVIAGSVFQNSDTQTDTNSAVESDAADTHNKVITDNGQGETAADALPGGEGNTVPTSTDVNLVVTGSSLVSGSFLGNDGKYVVIKVPAGLTVTTQTDADGNAVLASGTSNITFNVGDVDWLNKLNEELQDMLNQVAGFADTSSEWLGFKNNYEEAAKALDISGLLAQLGQSNFTAPITLKTLADGTQEILVDVSGQSSAYQQIADSINRIIDQIQSGFDLLQLTGTNPISSLIADGINAVAGATRLVVKPIIDSLQSIANAFAEGATTGILQLPSVSLGGSMVVTVPVSVKTPALADVTDTSAQQFEFTGDIVDSNVIDLNAFDSGASVGSLYYKKAPSVEAGKVLGTSTTGYSVELTGTPNATVAIYNAAGQQVGQTTLNASGLGTATLTVVSADDELYAVPYIEQASGDTIYGNVLVGDALVDPDSNNAAFQNDNVIGSSATFTVPADETTEPGDGGDNGNGGDNNGSGDNNNGGSNTGDNGSNTGDNGSTGNNGANTGSDNGSGSLVNGTGSVNNTAATTDNGAKVAQLSTTPNDTTASKSASEKLPQTSEANNDLAAMGMVALVASMFGLGALGLRKREDNM